MKCINNSYVNMKCGENFNTALNNITFNTESNVAGNVVDNIKSHVNRNVWRNVGSNVEDNVWWNVRDNNAIDTQLSDAFSMVSGLWNL